MTAIKLSARSAQLISTADMRRAHLQVIEGGQAVTVDNTIRAMRRRQHQYEVSIVGQAPGKAVRIMSSNTVTRNPLGTVSHRVIKAATLRGTRRVVANETRESKKDVTREISVERSGDVSRVIDTYAENVTLMQGVKHSLPSDQSRKISKRIIVADCNICKSDAQHGVKVISNTKVGIYVSAVLLSGIFIIVAIFDWLVPITHSQTQIVQIAEKTTITQLATKLADSPAEISDLEAQIVRINNLNTNEIKAGEYLTIPMR